ncbi:MAG TPA: AAA family ATPase [Candidatus Omnitrophota bacterium]|nr:AAA family ATPase [Candidatus Omnitrophota bacterium]
MKPKTIAYDSLDFNEKFEKACGLLDETNKNIFITGKAGTGKSTLLNYFRDHTSKNVAVLAPTGVAAINVRGQTIHSFFGFKPDITPEAVGSLRVPKSRRAMCGHIDTIIIDEISMVRADLLDCIDQFLQLYGPHEGLPFGGVQMVFIGDLYQLPPVVNFEERSIFEGFYKSPYFFDAKSYPYLKMHYLELDKIYRQKEEDFIHLLGQIRIKSATPEHIRHLNTRYKPDFEPDRDEFYVYLTTTNAVADQINQKRLDELDTQAFRYEGEVSGTFENKNLPTNEVLNLKIGAQVMLLNNDPMSRWINGTIGRVLSFHEDEAMIKVEIMDGTIVHVTPFSWEMFQFFYNEESQRVESETVGSFTQFPLRLAWAVTIHKSQGKTFSKVIVDIGEGTFAPGQIYVALSRCTNFEGLILKRPIQKHHILLDNHIVRFMNNNQFN